MRTSPAELKYRDDTLFPMICQRLRDAGKLDRNFKPISQEITIPDNDITKVTTSDTKCSSGTWAIFDVVLVIKPEGPDSDILPISNETQKEILNELRSMSSWSRILTRVKFGLPDVSVLVEGAPVVLYMTLEDVRRWERAFKALQLAGSQHALLNQSFNDRAQPLFGAESDAESGNHPDIQRARFLVRQTEWSFALRFARGTSKDPARSIAFAIFSVVYSGVHMLLWNSTFPTIREREAFRVYTLFGFASGSWLSLFTVFSMLFVRCRKNVRWRKRRVRGRGRGRGSNFTKNDGHVLNFIAEISLFLHFVFFGSARLIIVGEAFAGLRCLPADAYQVPPWLQGWPHL